MADERRRWPRQTYAGGRLPPGARLRPGAEVTLVNMSRGGALVESDMRLRWGTRCDFEWTSAEGIASVATRVVRCFVARLDASAVRYRTALSFERRSRSRRSRIYSLSIKFPAAWRRYLAMG